VRRLNRYVEERAPWQLAKDEANAGELDATLRSLAEGLRVITVLLAPYIPATADRLLRALGEQPDPVLDDAAYGARPGGARVEKLPPLFPKPR
jgi:methionyl-tRNA synthetase